MLIFDEKIHIKLTELIKIIWPYLMVDEKGKTQLKEGAPEEVKQAYEEYWEINNSFKIQS